MVWLFLRLEFPGGGWLLDEAIMSGRLVLNPSGGQDGLNASDSRDRRHNDMNKCCDTVV